MEDTGQDLNEDEIFTSRQAARHVCVAFKKYIEAHLAIKADQLRRSYLRNEGGSPLADFPAYKVWTRNLVDQPNLKKCSRKHFEGILCWRLDFSMEIYNQIFARSQNLDSFQDNLACHNYIFYDLIMQ